MLGGQLKKDRDSALNKVAALEQEMDRVITKIQVQSAVKARGFVFV